MLQRRLDCALKLTAVMFHVKSQEFRYRIVARAFCVDPVNPCQLKKNPLTRDASIDSFRPA